MSDDPATRFRENATEITTMIVTGLWLALLFLPGGTQLWLPVMLIGYIIVIPLVALLYGDKSEREAWWGSESWDDWWGDGNDRDESPSASSNPERADETTPGDALETLRERYAAGELTDDQFEQKLDRLLETETLEDADRRRRGRKANVRDRDRDRDRTPEYES
ncbi:SHOCT domain-containing protein [Natronorubrum tibetense]|uniref:SHOCT domain-containing protein n=1 Tax=Natronorubrum tibetense GA33 TaxID=1114856 RepID=L9VT04_9EURY|nr:SHOCT domain-containing protein [Natronorubrum tibetense]ELY40330.1 hypothetical protein C496_12177 [Natronorubrum tibetense GA33]